jgi:hypothetical protein
MKSFWITIRMGRSDILDSELEGDTLQNWLQEKLQHATALLAGNGKVSVERVDPLRVDVDLNFTVKGRSVTEVMEKFRDDFRALGPITQGHRNQRNQELQTLLSAYQWGAVSCFCSHRSRHRAPDLH